MSLSAIAFLVSYVVLLGLALVVGPIWGMAGYFLAYYRLPQNYWWGEGLPDLRWSFLAACVMGVSLMIHGGRDSSDPSAGAADASLPRRPWYSTTPARLLILLTAWMWLQCFWTINLDNHLEGAALYTKYVVLFAVLYEIVNSPRRMQLLLWMHVIGCLLWGLTAFGREYKGRMEIALGPEGGDSNLIGYHLGTGVAVAGFLLIQFNGWRRLAATAAIPWILNGIFLGASRSAVLSLVAGAGSAFYFRPRQRTAIMLLAAVLAVPLAWRLARSELLWARLDTLSEGLQVQEGSAASRIPIMKANLAMFRDYPFGVGYRNNQVISANYLDTRYLTATVTGELVRAAHSTSMAYLVDQGIPGGLFFLGITGWTFWTVIRLKGFDRRGLPTELGAYRAAIAASLVMHFVASLFINLQKAESWIWFLVALAALEHMCLTAVSSSEAAKENVAEPSRAFVVAPAGGRARTSTRPV